MRRGEKLEREAIVRFKKMEEERKEEKETLFITCWHITTHG